MTPREIAKYITSDPDIILSNPTNDTTVLTNFLNKVKRTRNKLISEGHKITIEIDDDGGINTKAKEEFVTKVEELGKFDDPVWVEQIVNGMKQVGVQGLNSIAGGDIPVTRAELQKLVYLLVNLVSK